MEISWVEVVILAPRVLVTSKEFSIPIPTLIILYWVLKLIYCSKPLGDGFFVFKVIGTIFYGVRDNLEEFYWKRIGYILFAQKDVLIDCNCAFDWEHKRTIKSIPWRMLILNIEKKILSWKLALGYLYNKFLCILWYHQFLLLLKK